MIDYRNEMIVSSSSMVAHKTTAPAKGDRLTMDRLTIGRETSNRVMVRHHHGQPSLSG